MAYEYEDNAAWSLARASLRARLVDRAGVLVLDIGCHTGAFLAGLPDAWLRHGVESAREPVRIAQEQHAVTVIGERIETIDDAWAGKFDAVTMFDVLEHLPDPGAALAAAARLVKPGGTLMVSSGDLDSWTWRWLGSGHWYLQTPQHLSVISKPFLQDVARRQCLKVREVHSIPHRHANLAARSSDAIRALYWGMRRRGGVWRIPHRVLQSLPGLRHLRHMQSVPWTMSLRDHFVATLIVEPDSSLD
ncbi:methyltransferase domain-containing protein [Thermomonas sp.]|uniref:class I SAM-dependent methyltransferase n=1 Tax=Thermomonas sp. TaxID=1971895 RepID=UPI002489A3A4|nr:methyltransferase domain-containing protein [Thermomonas sp.]MDI1253517.1 methyltransferase domain-containing protein [Thermomonas sp.]